MASWEERIYQALPESVQTPHIKFEPTTEQDVATLAQAYLDDEGIAVLLGEVGVHPFLTETQQRQVDTNTLSNSKIDWSRRDPLLADVALALARRVVGGQIDSTGSP